ncbi:uncharacterized protein YbjQ (UPF0145 family) [Elusimicrobium simillimum]|uniref:DUF4156 domain-containing protein n=1 Tax=Elusimicrobium simillimum TaxID=3143438 RepID=UPI003C6EAC1C
MKKLLILLPAIMLLAACGAKNLKSGAEVVRILPVAPQANQCKYLGDITGKQTGAIQHTANTVARGAMNDLKNKTYKMGGNAVYILNSNASGGLLGVEPSHSVTGIAYNCTSF